MKDSALRVGIVADYTEEQWPSMDLVAEMLTRSLPRVDPAFHPVLLRPTWTRRATAIPIVGRSQTAKAIDRFGNRYGDYAWWLSRRVQDFDVFHIVDHSYAHLAHVLPVRRTIVSCHDIDALRCLRTRGRPVYRYVARRLLSGLRRASLVACDTRAVRDELVDAGLVSADRLVVVHNGVHEAFLSGEDQDARADLERLAGPPRGIELLHVGSTIPRKRIDLLIQAFAEARRRRPSLSLLRAGGRLTGDQRALASALGVSDAIVELPPLEFRDLAALYRRAALTLLPSDYEGFGLPVIESMASGTPVLASRLPAITEVGGRFAAYAAPGDPAAWGQAISMLLDERDQEPGWWGHRREQGRRHAAGFTWDAHACAMRDVYRAVTAQSHHRVVV